MLGTLAAMVGMATAVGSGVKRRCARSRAAAMSSTTVAATAVTSAADVRGLARAACESVTNRLVAPLVEVLTTGIASCEGRIVVRS